MVRPLSRAGVPVLNRSTRIPSRTSAALIPVRGSLARPPAGRLRFAGVHHGLQERAGGENHGIGADRPRRPARAPRTPRAGTVTVAPRRTCSVRRSSTVSCRNATLRLQLDDMLDRLLIGPLVGLRSGAVHGRALAAS